MLIFFPATNDGGHSSATISYVLSCCGYYFYNQPPFRHGITVFGGEFVDVGVYVLIYVAPARILCEGQTNCCSFLPYTSYIIYYIVCHLFVPCHRHTVHSRRPTQHRYFIR